MSNKKVSKSEKRIHFIVRYVIPLIIISLMIHPAISLLEEQRLDVNHCLKEESFYYRTKGGFLFSSTVETTKENSDGVDYRCIKWEEDLNLLNAITGQKLVYKKGFQKNKTGEIE